MDYLLKILSMKKNILEEQVSVFLEWTRRNSGASLSYQEWLAQFMEYTEKTDIVDVSYEEVDLFVQKVYNERNSSLAPINARKAVNSLMRFYMARSKNGKSKLGKGRPLHIGEIEQTQKYRKMGLTFKEVSKLMGKNVSLVHRWAMRKLDSQKD